MVEKETVYEVRTSDIVIIAYDNREEATQKANYLNHIYGHEAYYYVEEVEKDSL